MTPIPITGALKVLEFETKLVTKPTPKRTYGPALRSIAILVVDYNVSGVYYPSAIGSLEAAGNQMWTGLTGDAGVTWSVADMYFDQSQGLVGSIDSRSSNIQGYIS
jgi:hypothetical protein